MTARTQRRPRRLRRSRTRTSRTGTTTRPALFQADRTGSRPLRLRLPHSTEGTAHQQQPCRQQTATLQPTSADDPAAPVSVRPGPNGSRRQYRLLLWSPNSAPLTRNSCGWRYPRAVTASCHLQRGDIFPAILTTSPCEFRAMSPCKTTAALWARVVRRMQTGPNLGQCQLSSSPQNAEVTRRPMPTDASVTSRINAAFSRAVERRNRAGNTRRRRRCSRSIQDRSSPTDRSVRRRRDHRDRCAIRARPPARTSCART